MEFSKKIMSIFSKFTIRNWFWSMILDVDKRSFPKLINIWYGISTWVEFCSKINKRHQTLIRYSRVDSMTKYGDKWKLTLVELETWYTFAIVAFNQISHTIAITFSNPLCSFFSRVVRIQKCIFNGILNQREHLKKLFRILCGHCSRAATIQKVFF